MKLNKIHFSGQLSFQTVMLKTKVILEATVAPRLTKKAEEKHSRQISLWMLQKHKLWHILELHYIRHITDICVVSPFQKKKGKKTKQSSTGINIQGDCGKEKESTRGRERGSLASLLFNVFRNNLPLQLQLFIPSLSSTESIPCFYFSSFFSPSVSLVRLCLAPSRALMVLKWLTE